MRLIGCECFHSQSSVNDAFTLPFIPASSSNSDRNFVAASRILLRRAISSRISSGVISSFGF